MEMAKNRILLLARPVFKVFTGESLVGLARTYGLKKRTDQQAIGTQGIGGIYPNIRAQFSSIGGVARV